MKTLLGLIWFATVLSFGQPAYAAGPQLPTGGNRTLTILVHDYSMMLAPAVHDLEALTAFLLSSAGIQAEWVWCNSEGRDARATLCDADVKPDRVLFRIQNRYPGTLRRSGDPMGSAEIEGHYASLYASEIRQSADRSGLSYGSLMAYAAVHEIGHLLLGKEHSRTGVMRGAWGKAEYREMGQRGLNFSEAERQALRLALDAPGQPLRRD